MVRKIATDYYQGQAHDVYILTGLACRDAETQMLSGGEKVVSRVSVACGTRQNTETIFVSVQCWNKKAAWLNECRKGSGVLAVGTIRNHEYNGKKYTQMDAEFVSVCSGGAAPGNFAAVAAKAAAAGVASNVTAEDWEALDDADGELPF